MKKALFGFVGIILLSVVILSFFTKNGAATTTKSGYKFNYYPSLNVYYDHTQSNLLYTLDGGKQWTRVRKPVDSLPASLGKPVAFYSPEPDAWIHNAEHRTKYGGVNTNFVENAKVPEEKEKWNTDNSVIKKEKSWKEKKDKEWEERKNEAEREKNKKEKKKEGDKLLKSLEEKIKKLDDKLFRR